MAHGGGVTPVVQTPDTDFNQHVKMEYTDLEVVELINQMQDGVCVPRCKPEQCIDMMVEVLSSMQLHLNAAEGYIRTGLRVSLDGTQDHFIVREAGRFWNELGMRDKINAAVAEVREEVRAGRLRWTYEHVQRLILPYPSRPKADKLLEKMGDDTSVPEGEAPYEDSEEDADEEATQEDDDEEVSDGEETHAEESCTKAPDESLAAVAANTEDVRSGGRYEAADGRPHDGPDAMIVISEGDADEVAKSHDLIATFESAIVSLKARGAMRAVANLENEIAKERRRLRGISKMNPGVLLALARQRDEEHAMERKRKRCIEERNAETLSRNKVRQQLKDADALLAKRKKELLDVETVLEAKHAIKTYSVSDLGEGCSRGQRGSGPAQKRRFEVLDRLARIGAGLSAEQRNDFAWWKNAWDDKMLAEHGQHWATVFAGWVQCVLKDHEGGAGNAFSIFVNSETRRCFDSEVALRVP